MHGPTRDERINLCSVFTFKFLMYLKKEHIARFCPRMATAAVTSSVLKEPEETANGYIGSLKDDADMLQALEVCSFHWQSEGGC